MLSGLLISFAVTILLLVADVIDLAGMFSCQGLRLPLLLSPSKRVVWRAQPLREKTGGSGDCNAPVWYYSPRLKGNV